MESTYSSERVTQGLTSRVYEVDLSGQLYVDGMLRSGNPTNFSDITIIGGEDGSPAVAVKRPLTGELQRLDLRLRTERSMGLNRLTRCFHDLLRKHWVQLPDPYHTLVTATGYAVHEVAFCGFDYERRLDHEPTDAEELLTLLLRCAVGVLEQSEPFKVGMDLRLSNFATQHGRAVYVDTFPPLFYEEAEGKYHVHIPQPETAEEVQSHIDRKFDPRGSIRRLVFDCLKIDPELELVLFRVMERVLCPQLFRLIYDFLAGLPTARVTPATSFRVIERMIRETPLKDYDTQREIAARWLPGDLPGRRDVLARVFLAVRNPGPDDPQTPTNPRDRVETLINVLRDAQV